jgi:hypothetical protein
MRRRQRNLWWSLAVLATVAAVGVGLPAVNAAVPAARAVPGDRPYLIGGRVSVRPPPNAAIDVTKTRPGSDRGTVLFVVGGIRYLIVVSPFGGTLPEAGAQLRRKIAANRGYQVTGAQAHTRTARGVAGVQGGYSSPGRIGRYAAFLSGGTDVEVTIAGADLALRTGLPALTESMASIEFQGVHDQ